MVGPINDRPSGAGPNEPTRHDRACERALESLAEHRGETGSIPKQAQSHLELCESCSDAAGQEQALAALLDRAAHPPVEGIENEVLKALPARSLRWRLLTLLPVAVSLLLTCLGAALVGGVPGGALLRLFPTWSSQGWMAVMNAASDWAVALETWSRNLELLVPVAFTVAAGVVAVIGLTGLTSATLRARKISIWPRRG